MFTIGIAQGNIVTGVRQPPADDAAHLSRANQKHAHVATPCNVANDHFIDRAGMATSFGVVSIRIDSKFPLTIYSAQP